MSAALSMIHQTERLEDLVSTFGQTAFGITGLLVAVAGGLLAISDRAVVIESRNHRMLRLLLVLLLAVVVAWIASRLLDPAHWLSNSHLYALVRDVAYAQGGILLVCAGLIGLIVRRLGQLVQAADR